MNLLKRLTLFFVLSTFSIIAICQETATVNGVADIRSKSYAFTNATIVKDAQTTLTNATLIIKNGKIISVAVGAAIPADAVVIDCAGKYIYPSFIDMYSDYGLAVPQRQGRGFDFFAPPQFNSNTIIETTKGQAKFALSQSTW